MSGGAIPSNVEQTSSAPLEQLVMHANRAPIYMLPAEVLQLIYEDVVHGVFAQFWYHDFFIGEGGEIEDTWLSPMRLASVCCNWKRVAFATPAIWSYFSIPLSTSVAEQRLAGLVDALEIQLVRAKTHPTEAAIVFDLAAPMPLEAEPVSDWNRLFCIAEGVLSRCTDATILLLPLDANEPSTGAKRAVQRLSSVEATKLRNLRLLLADETGAALSPRVINQVGIGIPFQSTSTASLEYLHILGALPQTQGGIHLKALEELRIDTEETLQVSVLVDILDTAPCLRRLRILASQLDPLPEQIMVAHKSVEFVRIRLQHVNDTAHRLRFNFPSLRTLKIGFDDVPVGEVLSSTNSEIPTEAKLEFIRVLCRSSDTLESLHLWRLEANLGLTTIISSLILPRLNSLTISESLLDPVLWDELARSRAALPRLRDFKCMDCTTPDAQLHSEASLSEHVFGNQLIFLSNFAGG